LDNAMLQEQKEHKTSPRVNALVQMLHIITKGFGWWRIYYFFWLHHLPVSAFGL